MTSPPLPRTVAEFAEQAAAGLDPGPFGYYAGGAGDEVTLRDNVAAWQRVGVRQRVLVDVAERDLSVSLLGRRRPTPFVVAPMGFQRSIHSGGEAELARGAAAAGAAYCLSTLATCGIGELAAQAPEADRWFQLYVFRDRGIATAMVTEAEESGFEALVVTADLPVMGIRDRDRRTGFALPAIGTVPNAAAAGASGELTPAEFAELIDPSLTWADLERFAASTRLPVIVKGVLDAEDAKLALEAGVAGIWVSNHGGRQLDTVAPTAEALPGVVDAVAGQAAVIVDGGLRRGSDVLKALALGADAVAVGRAAAWGLAVAGAPGVQRVLEIIAAELDVALALAGVGRADALDSRVLR